MAASDRLRNVVSECESTL